MELQLPGFHHFCPTQTQLIYHRRKHPVPQMPPTRSRPAGNVNLPSDPTCQAPANGDANMENADTVLAGLEEPDQNDIVLIYTGRHMWSSIRPSEPGELSPPLVAYEELPFPKGDRAKLSSCTVRWQFIGRFSINREEDIARGSFRLQVRRFLVAQNVAKTDSSVNFRVGLAEVVSWKSPLTLVLPPPLLKSIWFSVAHPCNAFLSARHSPKPQWSSRFLAFLPRMLKTKQLATFRCASSPLLMYTTSGSLKSPVLITPPLLKAPTVWWFSLPQLLAKTVALTPTASTPSPVISRLAALSANCPT